MAAMLDLGRLLERFLGRNDGSETDAGYDKTVGSGPLPRRSRLDSYTALALIDRSEQARALRDRVGRIAAERPTRLLLVVLPFSARQMHELFVDRFGKYELERSLRQRPCIYRGQLQWPMGDTVDLVLQELLGDHYIRRFREPDQHPPAADLCFSFGITDRRWSAATGSVVRSWVDHVLHEWPACPHGTLVISFLCIDCADESQMPDYEKSRLDERTALIDELKARADKDYGLLVLEPFPEVDDQHIAEWFGLIEREFSDAPLTAALRAAANDLFPAGAAQPMKEVYNKLYECVREHDRCPVQATNGRRG